MKNKPASIERNATASAEQSTSERAHAAENIFHSKPTTKQTNKGKTMKAKRTPYSATEENADFLACRVLAVDATGRRYAFKANAYEATHAEAICPQPSPTPEEIAARELAEDYHRVTEEYDRAVCTGPIVNGSILPACTQEISDINRFARVAFHNRLEKAIAQGVTPKQFQRAIADAAHRMPNNGINNRKTYGESQEFIPVNAIPDMADIEKLMKCLLYIEKSLTLAGDPPALACQSYQLEKTREAISLCMKLGAIG